MESMGIDEFDKMYKIHSRASVIPFWKPYLTKDISKREESEQIK